MSYPILNPEEKGIMEQLNSFKSQFLIFAGRASYKVDREAAADLFHDSLLLYIKYLRLRKKEKPLQPGEMQKLLLKIFCRRIVDLKRRNKTYEALLKKQHMIAKKIMSDEAESRQHEAYARALVKRCLGILEPREKEVVELSVYKGKKAEEIMISLKIKSADAVRQILCRAKKKMRKFAQSYKGPMLALLIHAFVKLCEIVRELII